MADLTFTPTHKMAANARRGLKLRETFGRGGTAVGVRRAEGLAERRALSAKDVSTIASYFARHAVDKKAAKRRWGDTSDPSAGFIAWLLWGGDEGKAWAERKKAAAQASASKARTTRPATASARASRRQRAPRP